MRKPENLRYTELILGARRAVCQRMGFSRRWRTLFRDQGDLWRPQMPGYLFVAPGAIESVSITRERFENGETFDTYRERILAGGGLTKDLLIASETGLANATIDTSAFAMLPSRLRVLVLHFDACSDSADTLPILNRIAQETGKIEMRIIERDDNPDLRDSHLLRGKFAAVPVVIFVDDDFNEIGHFIERPDSITNLRAERKQAIYDSNPAYGAIDAPPSEVSDEIRSAILTDIMAMREEVRPLLISETVRELSEIVAPIAQKAGR